MCRYQVLFNAVNKVGAENVGNVVFLADGGTQFIAYDHQGGLLQQQYSFAVLCIVGQKRTNAYAGEHHIPVLQGIVLQSFLPPAQNVFNKSRRIFHQRGKLLQQALLLFKRGKLRTAGIDHHIKPGKQVRLKNTLLRNVGVVVVFCLVMQLHRNAALLQLPRNGIYQQVVAQVMVTNRTPYQYFQFLHILVFPLRTVLPLGAVLPLTRSAHHLNHLLPFGAVHACQQHNNSCQGSVHQYRDNRCSYLIRRAR